MPRITFRTGREDCMPAAGEEAYVASKTEVHPSPHTNGPATLDWFEKNFGLTDPKEVVALLGAHTIGRLHYKISLFRYLWTTRTEISLNNDYYK